VSLPMRVPRPPPPNTKPVWEVRIPGLGRFYINGAVTRGGRRTYTLRSEEDGRNQSAVCSIGTDGSVIQWYFSWESREEEMSAVLSGAREFVLAHHVLGS